MAVEWMDGLDGYANYTDAFRRGWINTGNGGFSTSQGAYGGGAMYPDTGTVYLDIPTRIATANGSNGARFIGQFKIKNGGSPVSHSFGFIRRDRASSGTIACNTYLQVGDWGTNGNIRTGLRSFADNIYHTVDFDINYANSSAGFIKIWVDGVIDINVTGISNLGSGTPSMDAIFSQAGGSQQTYIDDIVVMTNSGFPDATNMPLGLCKIPALLANGDITAQFTRSSGATNFSNIDEVRNNADTDYVEALSTGLRDLYDYASLPSTPAAIYALSNVKVAKNSGGGVANIKDVLKSGATTVVGASKGVPSGYYDFITELFTVDPNTSAAWTNAAVTALQAGFESA